MSIVLHCLKLYREIKMNLRFCMCMCYRKGSRHVQDLNSLGNNAKSGGGGVTMQNSCSDCWSGQSDKM